MMTAKGEKDQYSPKEAQRRFEAALRGAQIVGHKPQSEMKLGMPRRKAKKTPTLRKK